MPHADVHEEPDVERRVAQRVRDGETGRRDAPRSSFRPATACTRARRRRRARGRFARRVRAGATVDRHRVAALDEPRRDFAEGGLEPGDLEVRLETAQPEHPDAKPAANTPLGGSPRREPCAPECEGRARATSARCSGGRAARPPRSRRCRFGRSPATDPVRPGFTARRPKVMRLVVGEVGLEERPRADERHVAGEHVVQLRQLVETPAPNDATEPRDARIGGNLEQPRIVVLVERRPTASCSCSAPSRIVRSLSMRNVRPPNPTRVCAKSAGPRESSLTSSARTQPSAAPARPTRPRRRRRRHIASAAASKRPSAGSGGRHEQRTAGTDVSARPGRQPRRRLRCRRSPFRPAGSSIHDGDDSTGAIPTNSAVPRIVPLARSYTAVPSGASRWAARTAARSPPRPRVGKRT